MQVSGSQKISDWLQTPLGTALLQQEARVVEEALDGIFGEQCLQIGIWGDKRTFISYSRLQRAAVVAESGTAQPCFVGDFRQLPIKTDSIDAVLLPHTLDFDDRPHAVLREVDRVLRRDGRLIVLGFKPGGIWGLRRLIPGAAMPPGAENLISERRLRDWMQLLDMRVLGRERYFFRWPLTGNKARGSARWEERGQSWWPELAACYMLSAQKRVSPITPVRPVWRHNRAVVGLAKPSTRTTHASRIRFDQNS